MKRVVTAFIALLLSLSINSAVVTFAYWNTLVMVRGVQLQIGQWTHKEKELTVEDAPNGTTDLNELINSGSLNVTLSIGSYFIYNNGLYKVTISNGYNPLWHGLPEGSAGGWAFISLNLDWIGSQQHYPIGAVVRRDGRFFQARHGGNTNDPLYNYGVDSTGKPWREIKAMEDYMFNFVEDTSLRDYSSPISEHVVPL